MTLRAAIVSAEYPGTVGGAGRLSIELGRALREVGIAVELVVPSAEGVEPSTGISIRSASIAAPQSWADWARAVLSLDRALGAAPRPDVLIAGDWVAQVLIGWIHRRRRIPFVVYALGSEILAYRSGWLSLATRGLHTRAAAVVAISCYTRDLLLSGGLQRAVAVVSPPRRLTRPPVAPGEARARLGFAPTDFVIASVGRLSPRKGHDVLLKAVALLNGEGGPPIRCAIVGDGRLRPGLEARARDLGLEDIASFLGPVADDRLDDVYTACDVFALPGRQVGAAVEGFGIVYVEAALHGKPSVATNFAAVPEVVRDGATGLLVDVDDVTALAGALRSLRDDAGLRARLGAAARDRAIQEYDHAVIGRRMSSVLEQALGGRDLA